MIYFILIIGLFLISVFLLKQVNIEKKNKITYFISALLIFMLRYVIWGLGDYWGVRKKVLFFMTLVLIFGLLVFMIIFYKSEENDKLNIFEKTNIIFNSIFKNDLIRSLMIIVLTSVIFCSFDIVLRETIEMEAAFFSVGSLTPNLITVAFITFFASSFLFLPKVVSKIICIIVGLLSCILFLTDYMLFIIKGSVLSIYDLIYAGEGMTYINFIIEHIDPKLIFFMVLIIVLFVCLFFFINKRKKAKHKFGYLGIFFLMAILSFGVSKIAVGNLEEYDSSQWNQVQYPRYYYDNFINFNRSFEVLGMYGYHMRDVYLYYKNLFNSVGSKEEIEKRMDAFEVTNTENDMTGIFKGKNLIMIQLESIDKLVITEEIMPNLYYMKKNGWDFTGRYTGNKSTIASEFVYSTGLYQMGSGYNINNNTYLESIPNKFSINGYRTASVHQNFGYYYNRVNLHKSIGYKESYFLSDIYDDLPSHDDRVIISNDSIYNSIISKDYEPFMSLIVTISAHGPYGNYSGFCYGGGLSERGCLDYLSTQTDQMLGLLIKRLEEDDLLDNTVLIIYSDHYPYSYNYTEEDKKVYSDFSNDTDIKDIPFIIFSTELDHKVIDTYMSDIDVVPTVLNLFGIEYDPKRYVGVDIFSSDHKNVCFFPDYSWYDGEIYSMESESYSDSEYFKSISEYVKNRIEVNNMIISNNYYSE